MRRIWKGLIVCMLLLWWPTQARAHGMTVGAYITLSPSLPAPGQQATISVDLVDPYFSPIPNGQVRAAMGPDSKHLLALVPLKEDPAGTYSGRLQVASPGSAVLRVEAVLPDGLWVGTLPVSIGSGGTSVIHTGIVFVPVDAPASARNPPSSTSAAPAQPQAKPTSPQNPSSPSLASASPSQNATAFPSHPMSRSGAMATALIALGLAVLLILRGQGSRREGN